ncbi:hypothetical protein PRK78_007055 [Emydomyces testavorans]|uniref:DUF7924 domain-containing protein n=1 Tax=Emydomyces testavorans TaxID=2070801 RepID=A0AAF0DNL0_9EURO|nr:hypothetical protein PRK78_007055 [Emydomyces testavorans]
MSSSPSSSYGKGSSSSTSKTKTTAKTSTRNTETGKIIPSKRSSPYDANFEQNLIQVKTYQYGYEYPDGSVPPLAGNYEETHRGLAQCRSSLSPSRFSNGVRQKFLQKDAKARNEQDVRMEVLPALLDAMGASGGAQKDILFTNINSLTNSVTQAKPDYYYGAQPEQLDPGVYEELSSHIAPRPSLPIAPNLFLEAKGPAGSTVVGLRQACHDGAIGARAIHSLQTYRQKTPVYDNNIYTISSTYHAGQLKMYGHSAAQPNGPGTQPEYYMHQLNAYSMTGDQEIFLKGATAFKNAMDLTKEYRNTAIARANEIAARPAEDDEEVDEENEEEEEEEGADDANDDVALPSFAHRNTNASTLKAKRP